MPIECSPLIKRFTQDEFNFVHAKLMGILFDVHNEFGRFLDEVLYKSEIASRWVEHGFGEATREVPIDVSHETFRKRYYIDLLFNWGTMRSMTRTPGEKTVHLLTDDTAFAFTALTDNKAAILDHQCRSKTYSVTIHPMDKLRPSYRRNDYAFQLMQKENPGLYFHYFALNYFAMVARS